MTRISGRRLCIATVAAALMATLATPVTANASSSLRITDLGAGDDSAANAINEVGHVAGQSHGHAFLWRGGRIIDLGALSGGYSRATDVNNHDDVVGISNVVGGGLHAFLWRHGVLTDLGVLPGGDNSYAQAVNDRGDVVGWSASAPGNGGLHAVRWRDGTMTDLGAPSGGQSLATDINNVGVIVGESGGVAVRWQRGSTTPLTDQPTEAMAVNELGDVTGLHFAGGTHGFLWHRGRLTEIGPPPEASFAQPFGINNRVQIVGYTDVDAFVWQRGRTTLLPRLVGTSGAFDINDRGQIVGFSSTSPDGLNQHAVLWSR